MGTAERETYIRRANKKVNKALEAIQEIGELANTSKYDYDVEDVDRIFDALHNEIAACRKRFDLAMKIEAWVNAEE